MVEFREYDEVRPDFSKDLSVTFQRHVLERPDFRGLGIIEIDPTGRVRLIVEGKAEYVEPVMRAARKAIMRLQDAEKAKSAK